MAVGPGRDARGWSREDLERFVGARELGAFERFLEFRRAVMDVGELQQELRAQIDAEWSAGGQGGAPVGELQRQDDVVSDVIYGMVLAKMLLMGQRTHEHMADDVRQYAEHGSITSDPDLLEEGLRSFTLTREGPKEDGR